MHTTCSSGHLGGLHQAPLPPDQTPQEQAHQDLTPPGPGTHHNQVLAWDHPQE